MKNFVKRVLVLSIFVLCLFAVTVLAASAEVTVGVTAQDDTHVASVVIGETTYYYADLNAAVTEAFANTTPDETTGITEATVTVLKDANITSSIILDTQNLHLVGVANSEGKYPTVAYTGKVVTIAKGHASTSGRAVFYVAKNVELTVDNLNFTSTQFLVETYGLAEKGDDGNYYENSVGKLYLTFNNVNVETAQDILHGYRGTSFTDCQITINGGNEWTVNGNYYLFNYYFTSGANGNKIVTMDISNVNINAAFAKIAWQTKLTGTFTNVKLTHTGTSALLYIANIGGTYDLTLADSTIDAGSASFLYNTHYGYTHTIAATNTTIKNNGKKTLFDSRFNVLNLTMTGGTLSTNGKNTLFYTSTNAYSETSTRYSTYNLNLDGVELNALEFFDTALDADGNNLEANFKATIKNMDLGSMNLAEAGDRTTVTLSNVGFASDEHALANHATMRASVGETVRYHNVFSTAVTNAADAGQVLTLLAPVTSDAKITLTKPLTVTASSAENVLTIDYQIIIQSGAHLTLSSLNFVWSVTNIFSMRSDSALSITGTEENPTVGTPTEKLGFAYPIPGEDTTATINITGYVTITTPGEKFIRCSTSSTKGHVVLNIEGAEDTKSVDITAGNSFDVQGAGTASFDYTIKNAIIRNTSTLHLYSPANVANLTYGNVEITGSKIFDDPINYETTTITFLDEASALELGFFARLGEAKGGQEGAAYFNLLTDALNAAPTDNGNGGATTVYLLGNVKLSSAGSTDAPFTKKVHITGEGGSYTVTTTGETTDYAFYLGAGADLTLTNVTVDLVGGFARIDGSCNVTFGADSKIYSAADHFIYSGNESVGEALVYTIDVQQGALIDCSVAFEGGMIDYYPTAMVDGVAPSATMVVKISGAINVSTESYIVRNRCSYKNASDSTSYAGDYTVYYDAATAEVTCGNAVWFALNGYRRGNSLVYVKGFASTEEADQWGITHMNASARTLNLDPNAEWKLSYVNAVSGSSANFNVAMHSMLGENTGVGAEIMIFKSLSNGVNTTMHFRSGGTITIKAYSDDVYILSQDKSYRFQIHNGTQLVLDGIQLKAYGSAILLDGGTAEKPSTLKLINGATIVGTKVVTASATIIKIANGTDTYADIYVGAGCSITQAGTVTSSATAKDAYVIRAYEQWLGGTITVKGAISSAVETTGTAALVYIEGAVAGNVVIDGGALTASENTATSYTVLATANTFAGGVATLNGASFTDHSGFVLCVNDSAWFSLLSSAVDSVPDGGVAEIQILAQIPFDPITISNKHLTFIGQDEVVTDLAYNSSTNADMKSTAGSGKYAITLCDAATLTFKNITIYASRPLFRIVAPTREDIAVEDRDVTLNFINSWASGGSSSSVFFSSAGDYDDVTINVDKDSKLIFAPNSSSESTMFGAAMGASATFTLNLDGTLAVTDRYVKDEETDPDARILRIIKANGSTPVILNASETAKIIFTCNDTQAQADHAIVETASGSEVTASIAASAIIDENGNSMLGDMYLYNANSSGLPALCITHPSNALEETIRALIVMVGGIEEEPIDYFVRYNDAYYYFNSRDAAQAFADANGATVETFASGSFADVAAAIAGGAYFRLGGDVANGTMGVHYFEKLSDLMDYAQAQGQTEIVVWVLQTATDTATNTLAGIKMTLTGYGDQQTLTMSGAPAFALDADSHLVVENVKIEVTTAFVQIVNTDTTKYTNLDLEAGAYVDLKASTSNGGRYFLMIGKVTNTGILTVNVKAGAKINATANATGTTQGLFQISSSRDNAAVAAGSSINVNGEIHFAQNYTSKGHAPIFMVKNPNLVININDGATVTLAHTGETASSVWHAIFCLDGVATINVGNATLRATATSSLFGINGANAKAILTVTGATFTAESFPMGVVDGYTKEGSICSQEVTFHNCTFTGSVASHSLMTGITLNNATFNDLAHAKENFGVLHVGDSATTGYYSQNSLARAAAAVNGGTLYVLKDFTTTQSYEMTNVSITIASPEGERYTITSHLGGDKEDALFTCKGSCNVTLQNIDVNGKGRTIAFRESTTANAPSSLHLVNADVYGVASGKNANAMIDISGSKAAGYKDTQYFSLYIDEQSSVGYRDGDPESIQSTRDYQVIFYYAPVTGSIVIEGEVYAYVYFTGDKVNYQKVQNAWTSYGPNPQHMIRIGNTDEQIFTGEIVITGKLTHKVVFPDKDENGNPVYPEDHPNRHVACAIHVSCANAGVFVADSATITTDYTNEYERNSGKVVFGVMSVDSMKTTWGDSAVSGTLYYNGIGGLFPFLNNNEYKNNKITIATSGGSNYKIVYDKTTFISKDVEEDTGIAESGGHDYYGAAEIAALLNTLTGRTDIAATTDETETTKEIIVGIANRTLVQTYLPQLEMNEYAIIVTNDKILILAWHDAALNVGVAAFKRALQACTVDNTVYLPNVVTLDGGMFVTVANDSWVVDFTKPTTGKLTGGQYVNDNSLQYVYSNYESTQEGQAAFMAYCAVLQSEGYEIVWQNVIENNMFRLYSHPTKQISLYVAYNDYAYKSEYYGTNGEDGLYGTEEKDKTEIPVSGDLSDDYFENRDHQKVLRVISMPHVSVKNPGADTTSLDMDYVKLTNTLETTLSFATGAVGMGHVYMLEDGSFVVMDGGAYGKTAEGDVTEDEAIWQVMIELYKKAHRGAEPDFENGEKIHLRAWYLTHAHGDHTVAFNKMMTNHGANIEFDYIIGNYMATTSTYRNHGTTYNPSAVLAKAAAGERQFLKVYAGQRIFLANLEIEVLMTYTDHAPFDIINSNDSNTVARFKIHNQDALNGATAEVLYLGDSWRHSSRILCEMYGSYLQTEIVQLAHHGNIGCERVLYKTVAPRAVFFPHKGDSFKGYVYFNSFTSANASKVYAFRYAADVWCAANAEYVWSAPYGTYNTLEFKPARPDYENIFELGIQPGATAGTLITNEYDMNYDRTNADADQRFYIHNTSKAYKSVNVVWGDLSFTYDAGIAGTWNPDTHQYENAVEGKGWIANGDNRIWVGNASTGADQNINVTLTYTAASDYTNFTGTFSDGGTASLASMGTKTFTFNLGTTALPAKDITAAVVGCITVTLN